MASTLFCKSSFPLAGKLTEWKLLYPDQCNLNTLFPLAGKLTEWKPASGAHRAPSDFPLAGKLTEWKPVPPVIDETPNLSSHSLGN